LIYCIFKRIFDFSLASFGLFVFSPLIFIITLLIFFIDGRPIFYVKKSLGKNGKIFKALKFRSMENNSQVITKTGHLLRQTAMDELPQLINIMKGEMSFVGPRNYGITKYGISEDFKRKTVDCKDLSGPEVDFFARLKVVPGLTGLAQIFSPKHAADEEVLKWDIEYIVKKNFFLDLYIIFVSIFITLKRSWEKIDKKL
jgi:lipopolysaccharide/colanic/teichoic acid biosynthesis glycosyltransferase